MNEAEKYIQQNAEKQWKDLYNQYVVGRKGADECLKWLESTDFFVAPASTRYHGAMPGGLAQHSITVCEALNSLLTTFDPWGCPWDDNGRVTQIFGSAVLVALLHDVCKANYYKETTRRAKDENGKWQDVRSYCVDDALPLGHGEKSLYLVSKYFDLTDEEAAAIRWHMGAFCDHDRYKEMSQAFDKYPLALLLHQADMIASHLWHE